MQFNRRLFLSSIILSIYGISHAQTVEQSRNLKIWNNDDSRLSKKCSIDLLYTRLWIVLDEIYKQTGIKINSSDNSNIMGEEISIFAFDTSALQILESIKSLLNFHDVECFWNRSKKNGFYEYNLERSSASVLYGKNYDYYLRGEILDAFEQKIENADKSIEERKKISDKSGEYFGFDTDMTQKETKAFGDLTSKEMRKSMVFSDKPITKEFSDLKNFPKTSLQYFDFLKQLYKKSSQERPWGDLKKITIDVDPTEDEILPVLKIRVESDPASIEPGITIGVGAGYGFTGGITTLQLLRDKMRADWIAEGDSRESSKEQIKLPPPPKWELLKVPTAYYDSSRKINLVLRNSQPKFETTWRSIAKASGIPVIMRLPRTHSPILSFQESSSLKDFVDTIAKSPQLMHKWCGDSLLICHTGWFKIDQPEKKTDRVSNSSCYQFSKK